MKGEIYLMNIYLKTENGLRLLGSTTSLEDFEVVSNKVTELENRINQMQAFLEEQN